MREFPVAAVRAVAVKLAATLEGLPDEVSAIPHGAAQQLRELHRICCRVFETELESLRRIESGLRVFRLAGENAMEAYRAGDGREAAKRLCDAVEAYGADDADVLDAALRVAAQQYWPFDLRLSLAVSTFEFRGKMPNREEFVRQLLSEIPDDEQEQLRSTLVGLL